MNTYKIVKSWYVKAKGRVEVAKVSKDLEKGLKTKSDETKISEVRDW